MTRRLRNSGMAADGVAAVKALAELSEDKDYAKHPAAACGKLLLDGIQAAGVPQ